MPPCRSAIRTYDDYEGSDDYFSYSGGWDDHDEDDELLTAEVVVMGRR